MGARRTQPFLVRSYYANERLILGVSTFVVILVFWEGLGRGWWADLLRPLLGAGADRLRVRPIFISYPTVIAAQAWNLYFVTGAIWRNLGQSALEVAAGLGTAIVIGIPMGLVAGRYRYASYAFEPFMSALVATPQVAFLPLIVLWIGTGLSCRAAIIFLLTLPPILLNAYTAVRTVDPRLSMVARSFCCSEQRFFTTILLPCSVPFLLASLRLAIGRAMIGVVVGELYGSATGVGIMINRAGELFQTDVVFVGVLTIVAAGLGLCEIVRIVEKRVEVWRPGSVNRV